MNIVALFPLTGNGGIASWAKKYLSTFPDDEFNFYPINISTDKTSDDSSILSRIIGGLSALYRIRKTLLTQIKSDRIDILHITTSGNIGSYRDICVAKICKRYKIKTILHCHYGCISRNVNSKGIVGYLTRTAMALYDQVWVLDKNSYETLKHIPELKDKIYLTPNSIDVTTHCDSEPKTYQRVAFVGNVLRTKGVLELVEAINKTSAHLDIIGPVSDEMEVEVRKVAGANMDNRIILHGRLSNEDAVEFMKSIDIVALPTYYSSEAFPISILEAMSLSKMVISCPRAAIPDMLTSLDGSLCGILVEPKSVRAIVDAITWCQSHPYEADRMCVNAYSKVFSSYRKEVVYENYKNCYRNLKDVTDTTRS